MTNLQRNLRCLAFIGGFFAAIASAAADEIPTSAYFQNGLVTQWDGIDNVGTVTHDSTSKIWKDLKGDLDLALYGSGAWYDSKALTVSGCSAFTNKTTSAYRTIEVFYRMTTSGGRLLFCSGHGAVNTATYNHRIVGFDSSGTKAYSDGSGVSTPAAQLTFSATADRSHVAVYDDSDQVTAVYADAELAKTTNNNNWNFGDKFVMIGDRAKAGTSYKWYGKVYAIRLYDRALSEREIFLNHAIDRMRFTDATAEQLGVRWTAEKGFEIRCRAAVNGSGGTVTAKVNGEAVTSPAEFWAAPGATVELTAQPSSGMFFRGWTGDAPGINPADLTISFALNKTYSMTAAFSSDAGAASYSRDGLIALYDGNENVTIGGAYNPNTTTWNDLSGNGYVLNLTASGSWESRALRCSGSSYGAATAKQIPKYNTCEIIFKMRATKDGLVFARGDTSDMSRSLIIDGTSLGFGNAGDSIPIGSDYVGRIFSGAAVYKSDNKHLFCFMDGTVVPTEAKGLSWNSGSGGTLVVGGRSTGYPMPVDVYALRLYDRQLSKGELARHHLLDCQRFSAVMPAAKVTRTVESENFTTEYGSATPAYGIDTNVAHGVNQEFKMEGLSTSADDGMRVVQLAADTRAKFFGWKYVAATPAETSDEGVSESVTKPIVNGVTSFYWRWEDQSRHVCTALAGGKVKLEGSAFGASSQTVWKRTDDAVTQTYVAVPDDGFVFVNWTGDGVPPESATSPTVTVAFDAPHNFTANFKSTVHVAQTAGWKGGDGNFNDGAMWDTGVAPGKGDTLTITNGTVTLVGATDALQSLTVGAGGVLVMSEPVRSPVASLQGLIDAAEVRIVNGGKITHVTNTQQYADYLTDGDWMLDGRVNIVCSNLTVDAASSIDACNCGYAQTTAGISAGPGQARAEYGASHGGVGAGRHITVDMGSAAQEFGLPYDSVTAPVHPGSSGGSDPNGTGMGMPGGGAIRVAASGTVTVEGEILADANLNDGSGAYGHGSGGSIWISAKTVIGAGLVSANGGRSSSGNSIGTGAGGRIAVHYDVSAQAIAGVPALRMRCGSPTSANGTRSAADIGTVYLTDDTFLGEVFGDERGVQHGAIVCGTWSAWNPTRLALTNAWIRLTDGPRQQLALSGDLIVSGIDGRLELGGDEAFTFTRAAESFPYTRRGSTQMMPSLSVANLTLADRGSLAIYPAATNGAVADAHCEVTVADRFYVGANARFQPFCHPTNGAVVRVTAARAEIAANGEINAQGSGFMSCGADRSLGYGPGASRASGSGASYGGASYRTFQDGGGFPYGDIARPVYPGSSGYSFAPGNGYFGSSGGGLVWLEVAGHLQVDGTITAKGQANGFGSGSLYGSGGGIYLVSKTIGGRGKIDASSYGCQVPANQGSGGRLAIHYDVTAEAALETPPALALDATSEPARTGGGRVRPVADMGTVWLSDAQLLPADGICSEATLRGGEIHLGDWSSWHPTSLWIDRAWVRFACGGETVEIAGDVVVSNRGSLAFGGGGYAWSNSVMRLPVTVGAGPKVRVRGNVTLHDDKTGLYASSGSELWYRQTMLILMAGEAQHGECGGEFNVEGDLRLENTNSWVWCHSTPQTGSAMKITARNVFVAEGAGFDATGCGYTGAAANNHRGAGPGGGRGPYAAGSHAGLGSASSAQYLGATYGLRRIPTTCGSGAGWSGNNTRYDNFAGAGGGVIWVEAEKKMDIAGIVRADGAVGDNYIGSGAGGSVYLVCRTWAPTTTANQLFSACGGASSSNGNGGGGGRISIRRLVDLDPTPVADRTCATAAGGSSAEAGTVSWGARPAGMQVILR